jgi:UDP-N-acetyl-D-mannosaminuronate dehydrogenase
MKHLIVGYGEVGKALHKVLGKAVWIDRNHGKIPEEPHITHICIPYSFLFKRVVSLYKDCELVIVHSSVPVGTCDALGVVHSPIRGVHPHLEEGIRTFYKYFGGKNASKAAKIFSDLGIPTRTYKYARTTEAIKLWDTTSYGIMIMLEKEIYKWCIENKVSFKAVYEQANKDYNEGYRKLGRPEVVRPFLKHKPGKIGGHCIIPNAKILGKTWIAETLLKKNKEW